MMALVEGEAWKKHFKEFWVKLNGFQYIFKNALPKLLDVKS